MSKINKYNTGFPIKIGDESRVASYAAQLVHGEEQLLITRNRRLYLTDGRGGYKPFDTINSGITREDVEDIIRDLQSNTDADIETINQLISDIQEALENTNTEIENINENLDNLNKEVSNLKEKVDEIEEKSEHDNRKVLDNFSESPDGKLLYKNKPIEGTGNGGGSSSISSIPSFGKINQRRKQ